MSIPILESGQIVRMSSIRRIFRNDQGMKILEASFSARKGEDFVLLLLGTKKHVQRESEEMIADLLRECGWTVTPPK